MGTYIRHQDHEDTRNLSADSLPDTISRPLCAEPTEAVGGLPRYSQKYRGGEGT